MDICVNVAYDDDVHIYSRQVFYLRYTCALFDNNILGITAVAF